MTTELVYRMRTCAAAMMANSGNANTPFQRMYCDAAELLAEASNLLDVPEPLGEPMDNLAEANAAIWGAEPKPTWVASGDSLPSVTPQPCPSCGNVAARKVRIANRQLFLTCPMCTHEWEYKP